MERRWLRLREAAERLEMGRDRNAARKLELDLMDVQKRTGVTMLRRKGPGSAILVDWDRAEGHLARRKATADQYQDWHDELCRLAAEMADQRDNVNVQPQIDRINGRLDRLGCQIDTVQEDARRRDSAMLAMLTQLVAKMGELARDPT